MLEITAGGFSFTARFEEDAAPETVAASAACSRSTRRSSTSAGRARAGGSRWATSTSASGRRTPRSYPSPGELIFYPGGVSETELLLAYGYVAFASKAGALAGNHFATIVSGQREPARARPADALGRRPGHLVQRVVAASASARTSTASATSSSEESSSGEWLTPPFRLRTKSIAASTPAEARMPASWPAPDASSTTGSPRAAIASRSAVRQRSRELRPARRGSPARTRSPRPARRAARRPARATSRLSPDA